jgi:hypothetical protein
VFFDQDADPAIFVMLNFAGLLRSGTLVRNWRWLLIGCLTFTAVATHARPDHHAAVTTPFLGVVIVAVGITALSTAPTPPRQRLVWRRGRRPASAIEESVVDPSSYGRAPSTTTCQPAARSGCAQGGRTGIGSGAVAHAC